MKYTVAATVLSACFLVTPALAGPYAPAAGQAGTDAVPMVSVEIVQWASGVAAYAPGTDLDEDWMDPNQALGPAEGAASNIVALGRGGTITLTFAQPLKNGDGWDLAVFENSFNDGFLELAYVEVSTDGVNFLRFPSVSLTQYPVPAYGGLDTTDVDGLAGKYRQGYGTPFDLAELLDLPVTLEWITDGKIDLNRIVYVRIVDVVGDGNSLDSAGRSIYDPYPTYGSAGFDLDAVAARYAAGGTSGGNQAPAKPVAVSPADGAVDVPLAPVLEAGAFQDPDADDVHTLTLWRVSRADGQAFTENLLLEARTRLHLTELPLPSLALLPGETVYWQATYFDNALAASPASDSASFTTRADPGDANGNGIPDDAETDRAWTGDPAVDAQIVSLITTTPAGADFVMGVMPVENVAAITHAAPVEVGDTDATGRPDLDTGLLALRIVPTAPNLPVKIMIYFSQPATEGSLWYLYDAVRGWSAYAGAVFSADGATVTLTLMDGDPDQGDTDGLANGLIVDPGGAAFQTPVTVPAEAAPGIDGTGGGCFILSLR